VIINDSLSFVIPVYLKTENDKTALFETIRKILNISTDVVVISQGIKPHFSSNKIKHYHSNPALGKWKAVSFAKRFKLHDLVFIHDGDNPFKEGSYKEILEIKENSFIQRDKIVLYAQDGLSKESRKYIELFLNKYINKTQEGTCADVQSGGIILKRAIFQELNFNAFGDYGGELAVYRHLTKHNISINTINMEVEVGECRERSNYTIEKILRSIIYMPLSESMVLDILQLCTQDCGYYISSNVQFESEVLYFLNKYKMII